MTPRLFRTHWFLTSAFVLALSACWGNGTSGSTTQNDGLSDQDAGPGGAGGMGAGGSSGMGAGDTGGIAGGPPTPEAVCGVGPYVTVKALPVFAPIDPVSVGGIAVQCSLCDDLTVDTGPDASAVFAVPANTALYWRLPGQGDSRKMLTPEMMFQSDAYVNLPLLESWWPLPVSEGESAIFFATGMGGVTVSIPEEPYATITYYVNRQPDPTATSTVLGILTGGYALVTNLPSTGFVTAQFIKEGTILEHTFGRWQIPGTSHTARLPLEPDFVTFTYVTLTAGDN
jgi:hypothetical protein